VLQAAAPGLCGKQLLQDAGQLVPRWLCCKHFASKRGWERWQGACTWRASVALQRRPAWVLWADRPLLLLPLLLLLLLLLSGQICNAKRVQLRTLS
jgi:hypothetical protein